MSKKTRPKSKTAPGAMRNGTTRPSGRTLGPVNDLEHHLSSDWWRTLFNAMYLKTDGDVVENQDNTRNEIDLLIRATGIETDDRILDLCCGQGRHCLELARRGYRHVTGLDRSRYLIRLARKRAKQMEVSVSFHEGDARKCRLPESSFNCIALMGNSFGYFEHQDDDLAVLHCVYRLLKPGGTIAIDLTDGGWIREHYAPRSWEWIDQQLLVCRERSLSGDQSRLVSRELIMHSEQGVLADQFYAERLYSREDIIQLLVTAGFADVRDHGQLMAESTRNQDLGMMGNRMFLTARATKKRATRKDGPAFPKVTVLMGDPSLPDEVKLDGQFNPEDFNTIDRLKESLAELGDYRFSYVDNHATLIYEMRTHPPEFVFNLCDEGYRNDAFKELHVPALLEMLGIPYTGAGPAALGMCYNKAIVNAIAASLEIPVPMETYIHPDDQAARLPSVFPAILKPNQGDSSIGILQDAVVRTPEELMAYFEKVRERVPGRAILIQEFLEGPEYSVGIIGNPGIGYQILPALAVDYSKLPPDLPPILGYESKWMPDSPYWTKIRYEEARLDEERKRLLQDYSLALFERLGCRDYARFDFREDAQGRIKLLEVNPNPGWCWDGKMNLMAEFAGLTYTDMLRLILETAQSRVLQESGLPASAMRNPETVKV